MSIPKLGTDGAFPCVPGVDESGKRLDGHPYPASGLTKRELFAAMAMQGILACSLPALTPDTPEDCAVDAVHYADALLEELAK